jgi:hypothetical protein
MPKVSAKLLRRWERQAKALDERARRLMTEMSDVLGFDGEGTDQIDNVLHSTEDLISVLERHNLDQWTMPAGSAVSNGEHRGD